MEKFKNTKIDVKCEKHQKKYKVYCIDCQCHLCKECLKTKIHLNHKKHYMKFNRVKSN